jgi:hypothetical protein
VNEKLGAKFFGPFQVVEKVGVVAYKLKLPEDAQIHPIFHVSQLKKVRGALPNVVHIPAMYQGHDSNVLLIPAAIIDRKMVKHRNQAQVQYLVQWEGYSESEATWEPAVEFEAKYPNFVIE